MDTKESKVLYFSSSKEIGFTGHFSDFALMLPSKAGTFFISGEKEQFPGIFEKLDAAKVKRASIKTLDTSKNIFRHLKELKKITTQLNPKIVHSQTNYQLLISAILKPIIGYKIIQTIHAFNNGSGGIRMHATKLYISIMCQLFADKVIFQSRYVEDSFPSLKNKSFRLPMGFSGPSSSKSKELGSSIKIIYAAKFHPAKNHKWLIDTLGPHLKKNKWQLILPGDGVQLDRVRELVKANNLEKWISLPGWVDRAKINKIYKIAKLAIVPSSSETLGHNIVEPLAYGIPVISFPVGIAPDIATNSAAVTCVPFYDAEALIEAIRNMIKSPDDYSKRSGEALNYFRSHLTWEAHIKQYGKIINEL